MCKGDQMKTQCSLCGFKFEPEFLLNGVCGFCIHEMNEEELVDLMRTSKGKDTAELALIIQKRFEESEQAFDACDWHDTTKENE